MYLRQNASRRINHKYIDSPISFKGLIENNLESHQVALKKKGLIILNDLGNFTQSSK